MWWGLTEKEEITERLKIIKSKLNDMEEYVNVQSFKVKERRWKADIAILRICGSIDDNVSILLKKKITTQSDIQILRDAADIVGGYNFRRENLFSMIEKNSKDKDFFIPAEEKFNTYFKIFLQYTIRILEELYNKAKAAQKEKKEEE